MTDILLTQGRVPIRVLAMNRPDKCNALNLELVHTMTDALISVQHDDNISVIVLAGAGKAFCAGADTSSPPSMYTRTAPATARPSAAIWRDPRAVARS